MLGTMWRRVAKETSLLRSGFDEFDATFETVRVIAFVDESGQRHNAPSAPIVLLPPGPVAGGDVWVGVIGIDASGRQISPRARPLRVSNGIPEGYAAEET
jgi:hypothetical protein